MRWFDRALAVLAAAFVVVLLGTVMAGVLFRAANHPLSWTDEAAGFLMVWVACLGWMIATRKQTHIRIRFFLDKVPSTPKRGVEVVLQLAMAVLGAVIAWYSVHLIRTNADIETISMPIAVAWMYVPLLPAGLVTLLQALVEIGRQVTGTATPPSAQLATATSASGIAEGGAT